MCTVEEDEAEAGMRSGLLVELVVVAVPVLLARFVLGVAAGTPTARRKASCPTLQFEAVNSAWLVISLAVGEMKLVSGL